jgi:hypothetical protein
MRGLVASATSEIKRRYATRARSIRVSPAFKGRAKFRTTLRVENHRQNQTQNCITTVLQLSNAPRSAKAFYSDAAGTSGAASS